MKRGSVQTLISVIIIVIALIALISLLPKTSEILHAAGGKGACQWNLVMSSLTRALAFGVEVIPEECKASEINITKKVLDRNLAKAEKRISLYNEDKTKYSTIVPIFNNPYNVNQQYEWAINNVVAQEMVDCWDKVLKGKVPIFTKWWELYEPKWFGGKKPSDSPDAIKLFIGNVKQPPINCIVCSRLRFHPDVQNVFGNTKMASLTPWMKNEHPSLKSISYYEYITDGQTIKGDLRSPEYSFDVTETWAVVYERINVHLAEEITDPIPGWASLALAFLGPGKIFKLIGFGTLGAKASEDLLVPGPDKEDLSFLVLAPYDDLTKPVEQGGVGCTFLLD